MWGQKSKPAITCFEWLDYGTDDKVLVGTARFWDEWQSVFYRGAVSESKDWM